MKEVAVIPILNTIEAIAAISTAIGVLLLLLQIRQSKNQSQTQFEDELTREYRDIIKDIPVKALLGEELTEEEYRNTLGDFYRYVDLSNTQAFLHNEGRINSKTWKDWEAGIKSYLHRPAFKRAWGKIKSKEEISDNFQELRDLEKS